MNTEQKCQSCLNGFSKEDMRGDCTCDVPSHTEQKGWREEYKYYDKTLVDGEDGTYIVYHIPEKDLLTMFSTYQEELVKRIEAILTPNEALDDAEEPHRSFLAIQNIGIKNAIALIKDTKI